MPLGQKWKLDLDMKRRDINPTYVAYQEVNGSRRYNRINSLFLVQREAGITGR
jgi:hypothetical protein